MRRREQEIHFEGAVAWFWMGSRAERVQVVVDAEDAWRVRGRVWSLHERGVRCKEASLLLHRHVLGLLPPRRPWVRVVNGDFTDCRKANLRVVFTAAEEESAASVRDAWAKRLRIGREMVEQVRLSARTASALDSERQPVGIREWRGMVQARVCVDGERFSKAFSIERWGRRNAWQQAVAWRLSVLRDAGRVVVFPETGEAVSAEQVLGEVGMRVVEGRAA
ncbi:MAG: hypothetical protein AAF555_05790 [Verrucomicrobiota bacterium]